MISIRSYHKSDASSVMDLMSDMGYPTSTESMSKRMDIIERDPSYQTFLAINQEEVVGMIGTRRIHFYEEDGHSTQITVMVTRSTYEGQGIGKALMAHIEELALRDGSNSLFLTSGIKTERERAHGFYKRMGFEITGYRFVKRL